MTPVPRIPSIMFHRYNDDLGNLDDVINGVRKIRHSAYPNTGFDFSKLGRSVPNSFNSGFDRIEESFCSLSIKVNCITILFSSSGIVSVFH
jgi:hypothetical protein